MEIGDLVRCQVYTFYYLGVIYYIDRSGEINQYRVKYLTFPQYFTWFSRDKLTKITPDQITPEEFSELSMETILSLVRKKIDESR